ncbi:hypothetical protein [Streptomyces hesseae]|uniref:DUF317 domain-containing protein n=1 Tax=Streptomyces hesseae TaxID=3075519 RepID=A0ABU2SX95_9ACTN|nr:hypothetical protein [Streptomyces sp. DSM 40473]MDT0453628.1 hypothetical protein [Streptomyces sp. DSM 40473]
MTDFPFVTEGDHEELIIENRPEPLLGHHGEATKSGGALVSVLLRKQDTRPDAWALTSRQEIHPDDFERTGELLTWLADKAGDPHQNPDGSITLGWTRSHEEHQPEPLAVHDGAVIWPS